MRLLVIASCQIMCEFLFIGRAFAAPPHPPRCHPELLFTQQHENEGGGLSALVSKKSGARGSQEASPLNPTTHINVTP